MNLKRYRKKLGLTQRQLVFVLEKNGFTCTQQFISLVENEKELPPYAMMVAFKCAFPTLLIDNVFFNGIRTSVNNSYFATQRRREGKEIDRGEDEQVRFEIGRD